MYTVIVLKTKRYNNSFETKAIYIYICFGTPVYIKFVSYAHLW